MTKTILISGASGFIGAHVLDAFLGAGYNVRAAVRSENSTKKVRKTHGKYGDALSFVIVPNIAVLGAFDEAVKDVDGVVHMASPFILNAKDYDKELFEPARNGTLSMLKAIKQFNPKVKRVVMTASFSCILDYNKGLRPGYNYTEADWNPMTIEEAHTTDPANAYSVSKTLAEHAAWDFVKNESPNFSITTICPPMVYGPLRHSVDSMDKLNTSSADIFRLFNGSEKTVPDTTFYCWTDPRDVAQAHLKAYESEEAANQRFIVCSGNYSYQKFVDIIRDKFPELRDSTPEGKANQPLPPVYTLDGSKAEKVLGIKYHTIEETVVDAVKSLKELEKSLAV
ncbi:putative cinnamoyl-CoA reductase [Microthyrium microscopicum]|uniref:Putative cinnamoyl-CoA reductase n=1 Tax=Microthyrium microscopicum TaxID=703497 RepID=A0A6A6UB91_9PEZI|nr:putative cinnamoyl-CoA reductase [Microthyrium microscopicum]